MNRDCISVYSKEDNEFIQKGLHISGEPHTKGALHCSTLVYVKCIHECCPSVFRYILNCSRVTMLASYISLFL